MKRLIPVGLLASLALAGCALEQGQTALPKGSADDYETYLGLGHYKAFAVTATKGSSFARAWGWAYNHQSVQAAIDQAVEGCSTSARKYPNASDCRLHSLGNVTVYGLSEEKTDSVMNRYASDITLENADLVAAEPES